MEDAMYCMNCGAKRKPYQAICPACKMGYPENSAPMQHQPPEASKKKGCLVTAIIIFFAFVMVAQIFDTKKPDSRTAAPKPAQKTAPAPPPELTAEQKQAQAAQRERERIERERQERIEYERCKTDLRCWGEKHSGDAILAGKPHIERHAKYDFEWTDGWIEPKLSHFQWLDFKKHTLVYYGDKIKLQNGFGAWQIYTYTVQYDPINKKLLGVSVKPGRLK
jgi:hypothetical protein